MSLSNRDEQVVAPFLVILRVADRSALTSDTITSGTLGSFSFTSQGKSTDDSGTFLSEYSVSPMEMSNGNTSGEIGVGVATTANEVLT